MSLFRSGSFKDVELRQVVDGDTVNLSYGDFKFCLRLWGMDAPERGQKFYEESTEHLKKLVDGVTLKMLCRSVDQYGRQVGVLYNGHGDDLGLKMIQEGLAWYCFHFGKEKNYQQSEIASRIMGKGIWSGHTIEVPWKYRRRNKRLSMKSQR